MLVISFGPPGFTAAGRLRFPVHLQNRHGPDRGSDNPQSPRLRRPLERRTSERWEPPRARGQRTTKYGPMCLHCRHGNEQRSRATRSATCDRCYKAVRPGVAPRSGENRADAGFERRRVRAPRGVYAGPARCGAAQRREKRPGRGTRGAVPGGEPKSLTRLVFPGGRGGAAARLAAGSGTFRVPLPAARCALPVARQAACLSFPSPTRAASDAAMNSSRSPSSTFCGSERSTLVRRSFTIW